MRLLYRALGAIAEVPDGGAILDVPCGGGLALRGLSPGRQVRYVAADIAPAMLDRTARAARQRRLPQVETRLADVERLPFSEGEFDLCLSFAGLHCVPHPEVAVEEIARCLRPGGRFVGTLLLTGAGLRYAPFVLGGRIAGLVGPSGSLSDVERWLLDAGLVVDGLERSGAIGSFDAHAPA